jgi:hypothetical protein
MCNEFRWFLSLSFTYMVHRDFYDLELVSLPCPPLHLPSLVWPPTLLPRQPWQPHGAPFPSAMACQCLRPWVYLLLHPWARQVCRVFSPLTSPAPPTWRWRSHVTRIPQCVNQVHGRSPDLQSHDYTKWHTLFSMVLGFFNLLHHVDSDATHPADIDWGEIYWSVIGYIPQFLKNC